MGEYELPNGEKDCSSNAEIIVNERNMARINNYINENNLEGLEAMRLRNIDKYNNPDGPTLNIY